VCHEHERELVVLYQRWRRPPKSACRSRLQTAAVLPRSKGLVVNDCGKGVPLGRQVSVEEMSESKPFDDASLIRLKCCRDWIGSVIREESGRYLFTSPMAAGV